MAPKKKKTGKRSKSKATEKSSPTISRRAVLRALVGAGLATAANLSQVSGLNLTDAVHFLMRMGRRDWTVHPLRSGERMMWFSEGTYLLRPTGGQPALYIRTGSWQFLGVLGKVALPEGFPSVTIEPGVTQVAVVPSSSKAPTVGSTVWQPNPRINPPAPPTPSTGPKITV